MSATDEAAELIRRMADAIERSKQIREKARAERATRAAIWAEIEAAEWGEER